MQLVQGDGITIGPSGTPPADAEPAVVRTRLDHVREAVRYDRLAKPVMDVLFALVLVLILLPLLISIAITLRFTMGSPIIFRQERVGKNNRRFHIWKFRTMIDDRRMTRGDDYDGPERRVAHKTPHDPRVTRMGGLLRRCSLDELPQLWNVLRGEMSLVGPRPELVQIVERYEPWQHLRHRVKPGMTGLWQVSQRGDGLMHQYVALDLEYVEKVSFRTDVRILLRTVPVLVGQLPGF